MRAAERGDKTAQNALGDIYRDAKEDPVEALVWYRKSAVRGDAPARCNLGFHYAAGLGVGQNYKLAMEWFLNASDQGFAPALFNIGNLYSTGAGVPLDYAQALHWWRKAADMGDTSA